MKNPGKAAVVTAALSLACFATVSASSAGDSKVSAANLSSAAQPAATGTPDPGQVLEIPPSYDSSSAAPSTDSGSAGDSSSADAASSGNTWSDGTHTYTWKNKNEDTGEEPQDGGLPNPSYAGVNEYMNQQAQAEAMSPALSPFFGSSMPLLVDPFLSYGGYPAYGGYPVLQPPVGMPLPAPKRRPPAPRGGDGGLHLGPLHHFHR